MTNTQQRVREFIVENFYVEPAAVGDDTSLISEGIVDSTGMLELIAFLEREYAIRIEDREMTPDNLDTLARIGAFVGRKRAPHPAAGAGRSSEPDSALVSRPRP